MAKEKPEEILISHQFAGGYVNTDGNIGHEFINFPKADDKNHYLYIPPDGMVKSTYNVTKVVLVNSHGKDISTEILGVAEDLTRDPFEDRASVDAVTYKGIPLSKVFSQNTYNGETDDYKQITYRAKSLKIPSKRRIFLIIENSNNNKYSLKDYKDEEERLRSILKKSDDDYTILTAKSNNATLGNHPQRQYVSEETNPDIYFKLNELIDKEELWEEANPKLNQLQERGKNNKNPEISFLKIIQKEDSETVFSNLLAYYLNINKDIFQKFAREILGISNPGNKVEIVREKEANIGNIKGRIDLWIETDKHIVVIENKINAGIHDNQLKKYRDYVRKEHGNNNKETRFYLFLPNYSTSLSLDKDDDEVYERITYKKLYKFFNDHKDDFNFKSSNKVHYEDFLSGLERHSKSPTELIFEGMQQNFLKLSVK